MINQIIRDSYALITGASSGIGKEFAYRLAELNFNLILVARRLELLTEIKHDLEKKYQIKIIVIACDLTNNEDINLLLERIKNAKIEILVNNAGFGLNSEFLSADSKVYENMVQLNCIAPIHLTSTVGNEMKKNGTGKIIFIGSVLSFLPSPYNAVYSATKSFDENLACGLWYELKDYNIDVISVNPGTTKTFFHKNAGINMGSRYRLPSDVVNTALNNIGKKPSVIDGLFNKILVFLQTRTSRKFAAKVSGSYYKKYKCNK